MRRFFQPIPLIMAKLTNHVQRTNFITSSTDKYYSLDSEDDFHSGCRTSVTNNSSFQNYPHSDDHTIRTNHFIVIIRVTTFKCLKMQMVINLASVSLSSKTSETISDSAECYVGLSVRFESSAACM